MEILERFMKAIEGIYQGSGLMNLDWRNYVMIAVACVLFYLAIKKQFEPLLLLPIAFGMLLVNLYPAITEAPQTTLMSAAECIKTKGTTEGYATTVMNGVTYYNVPHYGGLLYYLYQGVKLGIYPPLIFLGVGAMTDFGPLIANPKSFILGAAAQIGIFITFIGAMFLGFTSPQAGAIGIIGGADGPTAIYVTTKLAPELLGSIAIAAYSYMALVPIIQPPIMRALTTKKERAVVMEQLRPVSKLEKIIFPVIIVVVISILLPDAAPLVGMLMFGNLLKESGVCERISKTAQNELMNIITIFLGTTVGATATGANFLSLSTLKIIALGLIAFMMGTAFGVLFGKVMYKVTGGKVNPLIGSAGVSAVPMAARVSQRVGQEENPGNFLLMHAMGPNVAGVIGSAVAAGVLMNVLK
ncbi:MAG: sodium ion-translocating decarboxylase subunit beta [Ruminococcus sp.]|nr:sodium ion-translocating decarboxylase subunit beta [Ruminococcus sp.]